MRRALILTTALLGASAVSSAAAAQATSPTGLRYLSWPGKAAAAQPSTQPTRASPTEAAPEVSRTAASHGQIPLARLAPTPSRASAYPSASATAATASPNPYGPGPSGSGPYGSGRGQANVNGLTPASAFYAPQPQQQPAFQPQVTAETAPAPPPAQIEAQPQVPAQVRTQVRAQAQPQPNTTVQRLASSPRPLQAQAPVEAPVQASVQAQNPVQAPTQAQVQAQAPSQQTTPEFDPMAPRRDAPIFRLQQQAQVQAPSVPDAPARQADEPAASASQSAAPPAMVQASLAPVQGARFYSVHRQAGRQPDAISAPQPIYLDALPVELTQTPSSADLAQPDGPPALLRSTDGTVRAMPQTQADDLP